LVWNAAGELGYPFGPAVRLLILTGQRRDEVSGMPWSELNLDKRSWVIAPERAKNDTEHWVHLSEPAHAILSALPTFDGPFVFTTTGRSPVSGFSKMKAELDKLVTETNGGKPLAHWTLHDLRRTFASGCAAQGVALQVTEKTLNHLSGSLSGIAGVYNVHEYRAERIAALDAWAAHVTGLVDGAPAKSRIVRLRPVA
jgi:integrase